MLKSFQEWSSERVFSPARDPVTYVCWCRESNQYFWVARVHDWEEIHRQPSWFTILLRDPVKARGILGETSLREIRLDSPENMDLIRDALPDLENREPQTRPYENLDAALTNLGVSHLRESPSKIL